MKGFYSLFLLLLIKESVGVTKNSNIGSNWSPYRKKTVSRESAVVDPGATAVSAGPTAFYAHQPGVGGGGESVRTSANSFNSVDPNFLTGSLTTDSNYFNYQVAADNSQQQQQFQQQPFFQGQFPTSGQGQQEFNGQQEFSGFGDGENSLIETEDNSNGSGIFSLMSNLIESSGIGNLFTRMSEMFSSITGGSTDGSSPGFFSGMRTVAMSAMAIPLMLPMAGLPIAMGLLGVMAFPILQLTLPGIRRSLSESATTAQDILRSEECVERFSCNLARVARKVPYDGWFSRLEKSENKWLSRVSKSVKAARTGETCAQFSCSPVTRMQNIVRVYLLGEQPALPNGIDKS